MKRGPHKYLIGFFLPVCVSIFLFFNYMLAPDSTSRIPSETGFLLFSTAVILAAIFSALISRKTEFSPWRRYLVFTVTLLLTVLLDMGMHYLARSLSSSAVDGILNLALLRSTWQVYQLRIVSLFLLGSLCFFFTTSIKKQVKMKDQ